MPDVGTLLRLRKFLAGWALYAFGMFPYISAAGIIAAQGEPRDALPGDSFPSPWVDPGFKRFVFVASPNFERRSQGPDTVVDTIVIHATVIPTTELTALAFFRKSSEVSSHYVIGKDGSIVQTVSTYSRAWHAGKSRDWRGREAVNDFSIGIELVNLNDGKDPFPDAQIQALHSLIEVLERVHPIRYLTSHEYIAVPPGRKTDPKGFPWDRLLDLGLRMDFQGYAPMKQ